jgi:hypothetical protein
VGWVVLESTAISFLVGFGFQPISRPGPDISFYVFFLKMYAFYFTEVTEPIWTSMLYMFL